MGIISYSDVKAHLNLSTDADAGEVMRFIEAATDVIEQRIGPVTVATYTETHQSPGRSLLLGHAPVLSIVSVTETVGLATTAVQPAGYLLGNPGAGIVSRQIDGYPARFAGLVTVVYTAGRSTVPVAVQTAALMIVSHMWDSQRGAAPLPAVGGEPPLSVRYAGGMPPFVADLLDGYDMRLPGIA